MLFFIIGSINMYVLSIDIAKISRGLQFVCNDLLWLQDPVRAAKILMRCQTTHLYCTGVTTQFYI